MAVNASWPGVSMNVIGCPLCTALYAPMCCVMPPASPATTLAWRMVSSSVVLPWSTWPMHGDDRRARLEVGVVFLVVVAEQRLQLELGLLAGLDEQHLGAERLGDELDHLVGQRLRAGDHLARVEQQAHEVGGGAVQLRRELLDGAAALDDDLALGHRRVGRRELRHRRGTEVLEVATTTLLAPGPLALRAGTTASTGTTAAGTATGTATATTGTTAGTTTGTLEAAAATATATGTLEAAAATTATTTGTLEAAAATATTGRLPPGPPEPGTTRGPGGGGMRRPHRAAAGSDVRSRCAAGSRARGGAARLGRRRGRGVGRRGPRARRRRAAAGPLGGRGRGRGRRRRGGAERARCGCGSGAPPARVRAAARAARADVGDDPGGAHDAVRRGCRLGVGGGATSDRCRRGSGSSAERPRTRLLDGRLGLGLSPPRSGFGSGSGSSTIGSRRRPSASARRRTRSAEGSSMLDEWLLTPILRRSARSSTTWFSTPSSLASS